MKSIQKRITAWLLVGLALLWMAGGTAIYLNARSAMMAGIDADNLGMMRQVRAVSRGGGGQGYGRISEVPTSGALLSDGVFHQVRTLDGETLVRSENLDGQDLPVPETSGDTATFETVRLPSGTRVRLAALQFATGRTGGRRGGHGGPPPGAGGAGMSEPVLIVIARDLAEFDRQSRRLLLALGSIGIVVAGGTVLLLHFALRDGLRPLHQLGNAVASVDASSLDARFDNHHVPVELRPIVEHLDGLMARLESGFERERRFSADLAHELRTPIAELQVMADLSIEWPAERTDQQMRDIRGVTERMQGVVDTLLQLARLESGSGNPDRFPVKLAPLIEAGWKAQVETAEQRGIRIDIQCPRDATMPGNPELWQHVLGNLLANAAEYAVAGSRVLVLVDDDSIGIANPAAGLEPDDVARMFERFWRADNSRTGYRHCGLGLSLVKACVEAMGLEISASLEDGGNDDPLLVFTIRDPSPDQPAS